MRTSGRFIALCARSFAIGLLALVLSACSRTVTWEEEVPLNTGETIWIERSMPWKLLGAAGNPFDLALRPTRHQTIRFTYHGRPYIYEGKADISWIAVSPKTGAPILVAPAASFAWDNENSFYCTVPHYVQLSPDSTGRTWTWPDRIETWLYGTPANVMSSIPSLSEHGALRYTHDEKERRDAVYRLQFPPGARIDSTYKENACVVKFGTR